MLAGTLELDLIANMAKFTQQMEEASRMVRRTSDTMVRSLDTVKNALGALGVALSVREFARFVNSSIEAADHLNKLSQRTGIAVEQLSRLQFAAKLADVSNESLTVGIKKLNVSIAEGLAGDKQKVAMFDALGIKLRDATGHAKTADQVMVEMADRFQVASDGATKTAYAVGLMGKAGDEMIPLLNAGGAALQETMGKADALGITISKDFAAKAEEFNDNITIVEQSANKLSITLGSTLVAALADSMSAFAKASEKGGALHGFKAFLDQLGNDLFGWEQHAFEKQRSWLEQEIRRLEATIAAPVVDLFGQMDKYKAELKAKQAELQKLTQDYFKFNSSAGAGRGSINPPLATPRAELPTLPKPDQIDAAAKAYEALIGKVRDFTAAESAQLQQDTALTDGQKMALEVLGQLRDGRIKLTQEQAKALALALELALATEKQTDAHKEHLKMIQELTKAHAEYVATLEKQVVEGQKEIDAQNEQNAQIGLTKRQIAELTAAKHEAKAASLDQIAADAAASEGEYQLYAKLAAQQRELAKGIRDGAAQQEAFDNFKSLWDSVDSTAHDVFTNIFEGGSNVFKKLGQVLKASLLDLLYQATVRPFLLNIVANVTGTGGSIAQAAAGGVNGIAGGVLGGMFGVGGIGGAMMGGMGWLTGATSFGGALTAAGSLIGTGTGAGVMSGLAMGAGALLPVVGGIALLASALGAFKHGGPKTESGYGPGAPDRGDSSGATQIAQGIRDTFTAAAQNMGVSADRIKQITDSLSVFYAQDPQGTAMTQLDIRGGSYARSPDWSKATLENVGRTDEAFTQAVSLASAQLIVKNLQDVASGPVGDWLRGIDTTTASLETLQKAIQIAQDVGVLTQALGQLGSTFDSLRNASVDNQAALATDFGGVSNLVQGLANFNDKFLTDGEKLTLMQNNMTAAFAQLGMVVPDSIDAYKNAVLEAQKHLDTPEGRAAFKLLIQNADTFYQVAQQVGEAVGQVQTGLTDTMHGLLIEYSKLRIQLMQLSGDPNAGAYQRSLDTIGFTPDEVAQYDENQRLQHQVDVARTRKQLQDQIWQAEGNTAALRQEELDALYALDPALAAMQQHLYDLQDAADAAAAKAENERTLMDAVATARQNLVATYQNEATTLQETISRLTSFRDGIAQFKESLLLDNNLSNLTPKQRYAEAKANFERIAAAAAAGDQVAQSQLQGSATQFLQLARTMFGSGVPYNADFQMVQDVLSQVEASAGTQIDAAQAQLAVVQAQLDKLQSIDQSTQTIAQALQTYTAAILAALGAGLNPDNPLNIGVPGALPGASSYGGGGAAANGSVIVELRAMRAELRATREAIAEGAALTAGAAREGGQEIGRAVSNGNRRRMLADRSAIV